MKRPAHFTDSTVSGRVPRSPLATYLSACVFISHITACSDSSDPAVSPRVEGSELPGNEVVTGAAGSGSAAGGQPPAELDAAPTVGVDADGNAVDADGNPILDAEGNPAQVNEAGVVVDGSGEPLVDDDGSSVVVSAGDDDDSDDDDAVVSPVTSGELADCTQPGPRQVRRLSAEQYHRTLQSIFEDRDVPKEGVLSDAAVLGFHVDAKTAVVRDLEGELLMNYAELVAGWAADNDRLSQFVTCSDLEEECQREFIANFGAKAHREPLTEATIDAYEALFDGEANFEDGVFTVVSAMLQSPYLLYRREMGTLQADVYKLTPHEVASQLAYWLTDAPPDAQLYEAAASDRLNTTEDFLRETERLLQTDAARENLAHFVEGWLEVDKLHSKAKDESILALPAELRTSLVQETREFFVNTFYEGGSLSDLFTAEHTFVDERVASLYGLSGGGQAFERAELSDTDRPRGVLGHAAFLTAHALSDNSSPVQRAKIVIERLLCENLPPVPSNLDVTLDTQTEFTTNRERYEVHRQNEACRACHENLDPIGYAFEHYDAFGQYRDQENGVDVDASGSLNYLASGPVELDGLNSLSDALAASPELQSCLVRYWSYYTFGAEAWANAECNHGNVVRYAREQNFSLKSVLLGLVQAPHFSQRVEDL